MKEKIIENQDEVLKRNINMLEKGITLQEYLAYEEQIKINGETHIYDQYGIYVIYNETKKLYSIGNGYLGALPMGYAIPSFFSEGDGQGNPYMHEHYVAGDRMILKYFRIDNTRYPNLEEYENQKEYFEESIREKGSKYLMQLLKLEDYLAEKYDSIGENYCDYIVRMTDYRKRRQSYRDSINKCIMTGWGGYHFWAYYNGNIKGDRIHSFAAFLVQLKNKSVFLYELFNAIIDLLIKPLPLTILMIVKERERIFIGENIIQKILIGGVSIIQISLSSIVFYLIVMLIIQLVRREWGTHLKILDIFIKVNSKDNKIL